MTSIIGHARFRSSSTPGCRPTPPNGFSAEPPKPRLSTDSEKPRSNTVSEAAATTSSSKAPPQVNLIQLFWLFLLAGGISFGGGVVAYLREYLVRGSKWV